MHRTGLWANRYDVFKSPQGKVRERSPEVMAAKQALEGDQKQERNLLSEQNPAFANELWVNFRALQIFDVVSLYFCCDGYAGDDAFKEDLIAPIPASYDSKEELQLRILSVASTTVRFPNIQFECIDV